MRLFVSRLQWPLLFRRATAEIAAPCYVKRQVTDKVSSQVSSGGSAPAEMRLYRHNLTGTVNTEGTVAIAGVNVRSCRRSFVAHRNRQRIGSSARPVPLIFR